MSILPTGRVAVDSIGAIWNREKSPAGRGAEKQGAEMRGCLDPPVLTCRQECPNWDYRASGTVLIFRGQSDVSSF
jgi:hypothetical protein